ncbi:hypothetical protein FBU59_004358, partial [Linderina macrospora]
WPYHGHAPFQPFPAVLHFDFCPTLHIIVSSYEFWRTAAKHTQTDATGPWQLPAGPRRRMHRVYDQIPRLPAGEARQRPAVQAAVQGVPRVSDAKV